MQPTDDESGRFSCFRDTKAVKEDDKWPPSPLSSLGRTEKDQTDEGQDRAVVADALKRRHDRARWGCIPAGLLVLSGHGSWDLEGFKVQAST